MNYLDLVSDAYRYPHFYCRVEWSTKFHSARFCEIQVHFWKISCCKYEVSWILVFSVTLFPPYYRLTVVLYQYRTLSCFPYEFFFFSFHTPWKCVRAWVWLLPSKSWIAFQVTPARWRSSSASQLRISGRAHEASNNHDLSGFSIQSWILKSEL
jgi:hypothetical protein